MKSSKATRENTKKGDIIYFIDPRGTPNYWQVLSEDVQERRVKVKKVMGKSYYGHLEGEVSHTEFDHAWFHMIKKTYARELE